MSVDERLEKIEAMLIVLVDRQMVREWYSTDEFARMVGKAEFTVREWCRLRRVRAEKHGSGRALPGLGHQPSRAAAYQREGLLPLRQF